MSFIFSDDMKPEDKNNEEEEKELLQALLFLNEEDILQLHQCQ